MSGFGTPVYHPDYTAFHLAREEYDFCNDVTNSVVDKVCALLETYTGGGCWSAFEHKSTGEKLMILFLHNVTTELNPDTPAQIDGFKVVPGDWRHAPY